MLKHVLVTLDGSALAEKALDYARRVVAPQGKITLLTVFDVPDMQFYSMYPMPVVGQDIDRDDFVQQVEQGGREYLERIASELRGDGLSVQTVYETGDPATIITERARVLEVDAIVMSTHGRSGISRWLFGSVTQKVLTAMPCPVFVIPGRKREPAQSSEAKSQAVDDPA